MKIEVMKIRWNDQGRRIRNQAEKDSHKQREIMA